METRFSGYGSAVPFCKFKKKVDVEHNSTNSPKEKFFWIDKLSCRLSGYQDKLIGLRDRGEKFTMSENVYLQADKLRQFQAEIKKQRGYLHGLVKKRTEELRTAIAELSMTNQRLLEEIAERKKAETKLEESRQQIINILEGITDAFFAVDSEWRYTYMNKEAENFVLKANRRKEELIGKNMWEVFPESRLYTEYHQAMAEQKPVHLEHYSRCTNLWHEIHAYPYPGGLSVFSRDITGQKKLEQQMAALDRLNLVGEIAAGIAHEIRNPMTVVRGFLQMLAGKKECSPHKEYFDLMIEEIDRANAIITEFLSLANNKPVELKARSLNSIIENLFPLIQADAMVSDKNIKLELGEVPHLHLDEKEIRQLILNLVRNGLEAMPPGGTLIVRSSVDGEEVVLAVQDEGKGIEPEVLEKIGTPFFTTKERGTGLGLAVCYSIASRHQASISIDNGPTGSTFFVRFKITRGAGKT